MRFRGQFKNKGRPAAGRFFGPDTAVMGFRNGPTNG
jgi:hypothetical protein